jgi:HAD superfamily phosphoserine phosphatase-like hydrolase
VVSALTSHQKNEATIIVVTGSFYECILPIVTCLEIEHVVCAKLEKVSDCYTGKMLSEPTIGKGKANALKEYLKDKKLSLEGSFAYGDHESDISMLSMANYPVVVGNNPILARHGKHHGWKFI